MPKYNPQKDMPDPSGKVILVTGGTAGLGEKTILTPAAHSPTRILFTRRSAAKAETLTNTLHTQFPTTTSTFIATDLTSPSSTQASAKRILALLTKLHILICNVGIHSGTNSLSHALLIKLLLPLTLTTAKQASADVRIVLLTSKGYAFHPSGGTLAVLLYARELAKRYGRQGTGLVGNLGWGQQAFITGTNAGRI
ncbi:hypothetical protein BGZ57DRAFT_938078 [Hyaloscypha finlandica]|nr:hypothetical protein F5882DRAFT_450478 [Hyaloscypha sp. PMI_1271]KAH8793135.1 hypothetical protein BGZ57DRAFT_938078 [Hyaloscypha finlandica]